MKPLDYAPPKTRRMRWRSLLLALLIAALLLAGGEVFRRTVWPRYTHYRQVQRVVQWRLAFQAQCLTHTDPPDRIIFAIGKTLAPKAYGVARSYYDDVGVGWGSTPFEWVPLRENPPGWVRCIGNAFLHERHTAGGLSRLIAVDVTGDAHDVIFRYSIIIPGRAQLNNQANVQVPLLRKFLFGDFRIYAGQPDPADPAAFTIRCVTLSPKTHAVKCDEMLDGRLNNDGTLSLVPRRGYVPISDWFMLRPSGDSILPPPSPLRKRYGGGPQTPATRALSP